MTDASVSNSATECKLCATEVPQDNVYCSNCGYPQNGTEKEIAVFHARRAMEKNKHIGADKKIKNARNTLFVMAGITFLFGAIYFLSIDYWDWAVFISTVITSCIYLALAYWSSQKPLMALLLGLLLYLTTIIISAVSDPSTLVRGILWKVIIISYLGRGIYSASSLKK